MDIDGILTQFEATIEQQLALSAGDPAVEGAAAALLAAARPALRQMALDLAEQAAAEVRAQVPGYAVEVVVAAGEPTLAVRPDPESGSRFAGEDLEARLTLRLPRLLKEAIEDAADDLGDSVNSYVVEALSRSAGKAKSRAGRTLRGRLES